VSESTPADRSPDAIDAILRDCLGAFPEFRLRVTGACMEPALHAGDGVTLSSSSLRPPRIGDIVLVRLPAGLRLHRLVWGPPLAPGSWRTKGDRAHPFDPPLLPVAILATVVGPSEPALTQWGRTLSSLVSGMASRLREGFSRR
jgi:hypothetical protein